MAERTVQTIKQLLKKARKSDGDPFMALQAHRTCPDPNGNPSPAEHLFGRKIRTKVPALTVGHKVTHQDEYLSRNRKWLQSRRNIMTGQRRNMRH